MFLPRRTPDERAASMIEHLRCVTHCATDREEVAFDTWAMLDVLCSAVHEYAPPPGAALGVAVLEALREARPRILAPLRNAPHFGLLWHALGETERLIVMWCRGLPADFLEPDFQLTFKHARLLCSECEAIWLRERIAKDQKPTKPQAVGLAKTARKPSRSHFRVAPKPLH